MHNYKNVELIFDQLSLPLFLMQEPFQSSFD